jgi:hypothetical protein
MDAFVKIIVDRARQVEITNGLNKYLNEINILQNQENRGFTIPCSNSYPIPSNCLAQRGMEASRDGFTRVRNVNQRVGIQKVNGGIEDIGNERV